MRKPSQAQNVRRASIKTNLGPTENLTPTHPIRITGAIRQQPRKIRSKDDALARPIPLPEEAAALGGILGHVLGAEAERVRQDVAPLVELVVELGDDGREPRDVGRGARVARVEQLVHAVQQPPHRDAGQEVQRRVLRLVRVLVRRVAAGERYRGLYPRYAALREGGELGEIVAGDVLFGYRLKKRKKSNKKNRRIMKWERFETYLSRI